MDYMVNSDDANVAKLVRGSGLVVQLDGFDYHRGGSAEDKDKDEDDKYRSVKNGCIGACLRESRFQEWTHLCQEALRQSATIHIIRVVQGLLAEPVPEGIRTRLMGVAALTMGTIDNEMMA